MPEQFLYEQLNAVSAMGYLKREIPQAVSLNLNKKFELRPYQIDANTAIEEAIAKRKRQMLVAMATGTGKTFTLVNEVYRLLKSGVGKRILFLVDRRVLAAQAVRAFASFEPEPSKKFDKIYEVYSQRFQRDDLEEGDKFDPKVLPKAYLETPQPKHAFVYVCTIQRMAINLFGRQTAFALGDEEPDDDADALPIPIHAFDLIVADECHRGYTSAELSLWRNTLDHFDAIKVGLTATPAAHTKAYFTEVVYRYEYERAVREGYLVDFDAVSIKSDVRMSGVFLQEGEQVGLIDDRAFARAIAEHAIGSRGEGGRAVARRLSLAGVPREITEEVLDLVASRDEEDRAWELAVSRVGRLSGLPPQKAFTRLSGFLARRGYPADVARRDAFGRQALTPWRLVASSGRV